MSISGSKFYCDWGDCTQVIQLDSGDSLFGNGWSVEGSEHFCPVCTKLRQERCVHCGCKARTGYHEPMCPIRVKAGDETKPKHPADAQLLIAEECDAIKAMLLEKNRKYGNAALEPVRIASKASPIEQILVRIDDKLSRLKSMQPDETEDVWLDLLGYIVLMRVARKMKGEQL